MPLLELIVTVLVAVLLGAAIGRRWNLLTPLVLLSLGLVLGLTPALGEIDVPPAFVLVVALPALLYWESLTTSLREIRANLRVISLISIGLVVLTAAAVAAGAHALGLAWGPAWILGAVLAPTDATAVSAVARGLPRRQLTVLRAESLVNDGTALVIYAIAVQAVSHPVSREMIAGRFVLSYVGGALAGLLTWRLALATRSHLHEPVQQSAVSVATPFVAFGLAEVVHASGVLAVVVVGLALSQSGPRLITAAARLQAQNFWAVATYLLNGALFVLVGIETIGAVRGLHSHSPLTAVAVTLTAFALVVLSRLVWTHTTPYVIRLLDRRPSQRARRVSWRHRTPMAWAGLRGAVSLAAALGIPTTTAAGAPFPDRDLIILATAGVIIGTIAVQGLTLPAVIRWARLPVDEAMEHERRTADHVAARAALAALPTEAERLGTDPRLVAKLEMEFRAHAETLPRGQAIAAAEAAEAAETATQQNAVEGSPGTSTAVLVAPVAAEHPKIALMRDFDALRLALLAHRRAAVVQLRDEQVIDDIVLREVQARLDAEEVRLSPTALAALVE